MSAFLRLFAIETRRSVAVWFVPVMVVLGWWTSGDASINGLKLWGELRTQLGFVAVVVVPVAGAVAAWVAGREQRRGLGDALEAVPAPAIVRDLAARAGVAWWVALSDSGVAAARTFETALDATWGGPDWAGIGVALAGVVAASALGYLVGIVVPSRFAALLAAGGLALGENRIDGFTSNHYSHLRYLSPWTYLSSWGGDLDSGSDPLGWALLLWLAGIAAVLLAAVGLYRARSRAAWTVLAGGVAVAVVGAVVSIGFGSGAWAAAASTDYPQTCVEVTIPVCVHPAYETFLDGTAAVVGPVVAPVAGIPGVPTQASDFRDEMDPAAGVTLDIDVHDPRGRSDQLAGEVAIAAVSDGFGGGGRGYPADTPTAIQVAVARWLVTEAGYSPGRIDDWNWLLPACLELEFESSGAERGRRRCWRARSPSQKRQPASTASRRPNAAPG